MTRMITVIALTLLCFTASTSAGDPWWRVCRPLADYAHLRCDPCAKQTFKWAAEEVCRAPEPCVKKRCSLKEACCEYRNALRTALNGREVCSNLKHSCHEALDAYRCAAAQLSQCHECECRSGGLR